MELLQWSEFPVKSDRICFAHCIAPVYNTLLALLLLLFSHSVVSDSLQPHGLQHTRLPCPSPSLGASSNSCFNELVMPSNHLILCHTLLLLPSIFPSIRVFSNESALCLMIDDKYILSKE